MPILASPKKNRTCSIAALVDAMAGAAWRGTKGASAA
jgi:hypothetical protein